jgi:hypothetical protein
VLGGVPGIFPTTSASDERVAIKTNISPRKPDTDRAVRRGELRTARCTAVGETAEIDPSHTVGPQIVLIIKKR